MTADTDERTESSKDVTKQQIPLGSIVKDRITGFGGTVIGRTERLFALASVEVAPNRDDGEFESRHFDEAQIMLIAEGKAPDLSRRIA